VRALAERAGIQVEESKAPGAFSEQDRQKKAKEDLYAVNALAATYFEEQLRRHEHRSYALEELEKRGVVPGKDTRVDEVLQAFRIGYAPSGWDGLATFLRAQGVSPVAAETVGLLVPRTNGSGYYDRFRHRLMFAVVDPQGRVVAFSGRALRSLPDEKKDEAPPKYINSPESPIYTKGQMLFGIHQARHAIRSQEVAVLVEGNFDVVSLHARGIQNVVAPLGTAFTTEQAKLLKRFAPSIVFLFDGDAAGKKAVRLSREAVRAAGVAARVGELPNGVDPDQLAREKGARAIEDLVASAKGMLEALIDMALDESFSQADAYEKQSRVDYVVKLIAEEDDPLVRTMLKSYADQLAGRLDLSRSPEAFRALEQRVKQAYAKAQQAREAELRKREAASRAVAARPDDAAESGVHSRISARSPGSAERKAMVGALIEWPVLLDDPAVQEELAHLEGASVQIVAALRRAWNGADKSLDTDAFLGDLAEPLRAFAAARLAGPETESVEEAKGYLLDSANKLKRLLLSQEAAQIARETYRAQGDWDTERELLREAAERLRAKHGLKP
jgi:DNA primase